MPGAVELFAACRSAGIKVCLSTGFSPLTRDAIIAALGWRPLVDLLLSPADAGRGRPWPDMPLTALLRLGGGAVSSLAVVGDTPADVESGLRAGAGLVVGVLSGDAARADLEAVPRGDRPARHAADPRLGRGPAAAPWLRPEPPPGLVADRENPEPNRARFLQNPPLANPCGVLSLLSAFSDGHRIHTKFLIICHIRQILPY